MRFLHLVLAALLLSLMPLAARAASVSVTVNAAGVQTSQVAGVTTETFNGFSTGNYTSLNTAVGTISDPTGSFEIVAANEYGGAGGTGNYMAVGAQSGSGAPADLVLSTGPTTYFGFWLSAMDVNNEILVYSGGTGGTLLQTIDESATGANITAITTLVGTSGAYYGNPTANFSGQDSSEPFQYINITATSGTFDTIVFYNGGQTGTGLETDNYSILANSPVPLPSSAAMGLTALLLAGGALVLRRSAYRPC